MIKTLLVLLVLSPEGKIAESVRTETTDMATYRMALDIAMSRPDVSQNLEKFRKAGFATFLGCLQEDK